MIVRYFLVFALIEYGTSVYGSIEVNTNEGKIMGKFDKTLKGKTFRSFTGIPYAEPPVGALRFKAPVPAQKWKGILDATKPHNVCTQTNLFFGDHNVIGSEDCLYLNVYAPEKPTDTLVPVMFYIHGGGWICGSANSDLLGPQMLLEEDIVLVVTNYRLGALGFMSTGDAILPGNNGLKDQNLALKWTKNNIKYFGGNPDKITVFGQSAGGASAHYHTFSPLSRDLISGAILQSGNALTPWAFTHKPLENAKRLAIFLKCPTDSSAAMIECLRNVEAHEIVKQDEKFYVFSWDPMIPFKPVAEPHLEGAFITEEPAKMIKLQKSAKVPVMIGITTDEGAVKSAALFKDQNLIEELNNNFNGIAPYMFTYDEVEYNTTGVAEKIRKFYFGDRPIDSNLKSELSNALTDILFYAGTDAVIEMHTKYGYHPTYFYMFGYRGHATFTTLFKSDNDDYEYGVGHCDELLYLFTNAALTTPEMLAQDQRMIDAMVALWTNFAKTGDPTPSDSNLLLVKWDPVSSQNHEHYFIDGNGSMGMRQNWELDRLNFVRTIKLNPGMKKVRDEL